MVDTNELKKAKALWQTHRFSFILNDGLIFLHLILRANWLNIGLSQANSLSPASRIKSIGLNLTTACILHSRVKNKISGWHFLMNKLWIPI